MKVERSSGAADQHVKQVILGVADAVLPRLPDDAAAAAASGDASEELDAFYRSSGAEIPGLADEVLRVVDEQLYGPQQKQLRMLLSLMSWRLPTLLLAGPRHALSARFPFVRPFQELDTAQRQAVLLGMARSPVPQLRGAYKALKCLVASVALSSADDNPFFGAMRYKPGPDVSAASAGPPPPDADAAEEMLASATLHLPDVLAQAGGSAAAVAAFLARRGFATAPPPDGSGGGGSGGGGDVASSAQDVARQRDQGGAAAAAAPNGTATTPSSSTTTGSSSSGDGAAVVELHYDAVVVGSGPGGGVTAAVLAAAGMRVLVLEKGAWVRRAQMTWREADAHRDMYERAGFMVSSDGALTMLAGATLGGGSKVNWTASLAPPEHVRREWAAAPHGLAALAPGAAAFDASVAAVTARLGVRPPGATKMSGPNQALLRGLAALGQHGGELPRNCSSEACHAYCNLGCRTGAKASSDVTWLVDAVRAGAHVLTGADARRVLTRPLDQQQQQQQQAGEGEGEDCSSSNSRTLEAVGVEVAAAAAASAPSSSSASSSPPPPPLLVRVHAPVVVASCGSLHTPALLLRSGVAGGGQVGAHLRLHPASGVVGFFEPTPEQRAARRGAVEMYDGVSMGSYSLGAARWADGGYGAMLSVPAAHPGLLAAICPDASPGALKRTMLRLPDLAASVVFTRDCGEGRVRADHQGRPVVDYWPDAATRAHLLDGLELGLRAYAAAGAARVMIPNAVAPWAVELPPGEPADARAARVDALVRRVRAEGVRRFDMPLFSAHQMGSCRLSSHPSRGAVDPRGEAWQVARLYVADASLLPTPSGVNPMVTVYALSHLVATGIAAAWRQERRRQRQRQQQQQHKAADDAEAIAAYAVL